MKKLLIGLLVLSSFSTFASKVCVDVNENEINLSKAMNKEFGKYKYNYISKGSRYSGKLIYETIGTDFTLKEKKQVFVMLKTCLEVVTEHGFRELALAELTIFTKDGNGSANISGSKQYKSIYIHKNTTVDECVDGFMQGGVN